MEEILTDIVLGTFTLGGVCVGTSLNRYYLSRDRKKEQIIRLQNVQLVLAKMLNELECIQKHFQAPDPSVLMLDEHDWVLSKGEVLSLNIDSDEEIVMLLYDLMIETKKFNDLKMAIKDDVEEIIAIRASALQDIRRRIQRIDLEELLKRLYAYSKKKYPYAKFITRNKNQHS